MDVKQLLDNINELTTEEKVNLMNNTRLEDIAEYINNKGTQKESVIEMFQLIVSSEAIFKFVNLLKNDADKAKVMIYCNANVGDLLQMSDNSFTRNLLIKQTSDLGYQNDQLIESVNEYEIYRDMIDSLDTEREKTELIATIGDFDLRLHFLEEIENKENRKYIIDSFDGKLDPDIKSQAELVQTMIREYVEDNWKEYLDDKKRERMDIAFKSSNVSYEQLEPLVNGKTNFLYDYINISSRHIHNKNKTIGFLAHEYCHLLSKADYKTEGIITPDLIEEGMADLFADLVINHYIEKHGSVELDGKKIRIDYPYEIYSGYNNENAWTRAMLYGISKTGKDKEVMQEYILGDKQKALDTWLEQENVDMFVDLNTLYQMPHMDFSDIDLDSIYAKRSFVLNLFELQNRLKSKNIDVIGVVDNGMTYFADFIGDKYFDNRKLYEISREEMEEFNRLLIGQTNPVGKSSIVNYADFYNKKIDEITDEEIQEHSFEILETSLALWPEMTTVGQNVEYVWGECFAKEIEKVNNGQPSEESLRKYERIIPDYLKLINPDDGETNLYLIDFIKDLKFACMEQAKNEAKNTKKKEKVHEGEENGREDI